MADLPALGAPPDVRPPPGPLLAARAAEQLALAGTSLLLAARLGPDRFAPLGVLLVVSSVALTTADLGLGLRVLRLEAGRQVDHRSLLNVRYINGALLAVALGTTTVVRGDARSVVAAGALLWVITAEATAHKAGALRFGKAERVAVSEGVGAAVLSAAAVGAWVMPSSAFAWVAGGLIGKQATELVLARPWAQAYGDGVVDPDWLGVWLSQAFAFAIANVDYLIIGLIGGKRALATYVVAYRLANAVPSQVAFVAGRMATIDLASGSNEHRQSRYERYVRVLFASGAVGAGAVVVASPALSWFLGADWSGSGWTLAVLAVAAPWRTILGTAGVLAIVSGGANRLLRWEAVRLTCVVAVLVVGAVAGFAAFLACVVLVPVVSTLVYHRIAGQLASVRPWSSMVPAAVTTVVLIGLMTALGARTLDVVS